MPEQVSSFQGALNRVQRKQDLLAEAVQRKSNKFNPLNMDNVEHVDGDTFRFIDSGVSFRFGSGDPNKSFDTFESNLWAYSDEAPGGRKRFERHRRNMSKLTGRSEFAISKQDLVDRGVTQSAQTRQRMEEAGREGHLSITAEGLDATGKRVLGEVIDNRTGRNFFDSLAGPEQNASFDSKKFNSQGIIDDILSGDKGERERFSGSRSFKNMFKDQVPNILTGAGRMVNDLAQTAAVLTGTNSGGVDEFFGNNRERLERFSERRLSPEAKSRNRQTERNAARQAEFFEVNKQRYIDEEGMTPQRAALSAGIDEFGDSMKSLLTNPGRILDATVESLPFMITVAGISRVALSKAVKSQTKQIAKVISKNVDGVEKGALLTRASMQRYLASDAGKKAMNKTATRTAVTSVGLLEGFTNGAGVYESINSMTEEEAMQSEKYQALRFDQGMTHEQAVKELAEEALVGTVVATSLAAAAAGKISGAAGFEGNLLSNLGVKATVGKTAKGAVKSGVVRSSLRGLGRFAKKHQKPGRQEAVEETLQSGGGEFISQLESFEATGKEVGSGVGAATAEGAVIGFASGAGISSLTGGIKSIGSGLTKSTHSLKEQGPAIPLVKAGTPNPTPGGSTREVLNDVAKQGKKYNPELELLKTMQQIDAEFAEEKVNFGSFAALKTHFEAYIAATPEEKQDADFIAEFERVQSVFKTQVTRAATEALDKAPEERTAGENAAIVTAAQLGSLTESDKKRYVEENQDNGDVLEAIGDTNDAVKTAQEAEDATTAEQVHAETSKEVDRVHREKMGLGVNSDGKLGLEGHIAVLREIMNDPDPQNRKKEFLAAAAKLKNFYGTQKRNLEKYRQAVVEEKNIGKVHFIPQKNGVGGTQGMLEALEVEIEQMARARRSLGQQYEATFGTDTRVSKIVADKLPSELKPVKVTEATESTKVEKLSTKVEKTEKKAPKPRIKGKPAVIKPASSAETAEKASESTTEEAKNAPNPVRRELRDIFQLVKKTDNFKEQEKLLKRAGAILEEHTGPNTDAIRARFVELTATVRADEAARHTTEGEKSEAASAASEAQQAATSDERLQSDASAASEEQLSKLEDVVAEDEQEESGFEQTTPPVDNSQANRLGAATRLLQKFQKGDLSKAELRVAGQKDNAQLQLMLEKATTKGEIEAALNEFLNFVEPDISKRNVRNAINHKIPQQTMDQLVVLSNALNKGKRVKALGMNKFWLNILELAEKGARSIVTFAGRNPEKSKALNTLDSAKKFLAERKLPTQLSDVFESKTDTGSLLSAMPNLMEVLTDDGAKNDLFNNLNITPAEEHALTTFIQFYKEFNTKLNDIRKGLRTGVPFVDEILRDNSLHYFEDNDGNLDPNIVAAMALAGMNWLIGDGPATVFNDEDAIRGILRIPEFTELPGNSRQVLTHVGTLRNNAARDMGFDALDQMSLKPKVSGKFDPLFASRLATTLGSTTIGVLAAMENRNGTNRVQLKNVPGPWFNGLTVGLPQHEQTLKQEDAQVPFIRNKSEEVVEEDETIMVDANRDIRNATTEGHAIFSRLFGNVARVRMPSFDMPTKADTRVRKSHTHTSPTDRAALLNNSQQPWLANLGMTNLLSRFIGRDLLEVGHGWVNEEDMAKKHITNVEGLKSTNAALERDLEAAMGWADQYNDRHFFLTMFMGRPGRFFINSNVINPQSSKIHRSIFDMAEWANEIVVDPKDKDFSQEAVNDFKMAVALAFGIKTDRVFPEETLRQLEEITLSEAFAEAMAVIDKDTPIVGTDFDAISIFISEQAASGKGGEGIYTLRALYEYNKFLNATGRTVTLAMPNETDGVNNGIIAGIMQTPPADLEIVRGMLEGGGIYLDDSAFSSFAEYLAVPGNKDNYEQVALGVKKALGMMQEGAFSRTKTRKDRRNGFIYQLVAKVAASGLVPNLQALETKDGRKWTKNPLIVKSYSASTLSIQHAITRAALEKFHEKLAEAGESNNAETIAIALQRGYDVANVAWVANRKAGFKTKRFDAEMQQDVWEHIGPDAQYAWTAAKVESLAKTEFGGDIQRLARELTIAGDALTLFNTGIMETYGVGLGVAIDDMMEPLEAARVQMHHANRFMNEIFVEDYTRRVLKMEASRKTVLGPREIEQILREMHGEGLVPAIATAQAEDDLRQNLEVTKYRQKHIGGDKTYGRAFFNAGSIPNTIFNDSATEFEERKTASILSRIMSREPIADVGVAAVVKMIHSLDGTNNQLMWGKFAVLNLHDATYGNFLRTREVTEVGNQGFFDTHTGYDLVAETGKSMLRMNAILHENDSRLTPAQKTDVRKRFIEYLVERKELEGIDYNHPEVFEVIVDGWIGTYRGTMIRITQSKENLASRVASVSQFAYHGAEAAQTPRDATDTRTRADDMPLTVLMQRVRAGLTAKGVPLVDAAINDLVIVLGDTDIDVNQHLRNYIADRKPNGAAMLEVLQAAFRRSGHLAGQVLSDLNNAMKPYLSTVVFELVPAAKWQQMTKGRTRGRYSTGRDVIQIPEQVQDIDAIHLAQTIAHELVHAATFHRLIELEQTNNTAFLALVKTAREWATITNNKNTGSIAAAEIRHYMNLVDKDGKRHRLVHAVTEYLAYNLTEEAGTEDYALNWNKGVQVNKLMGDLFDSLQDPRTGTAVLRNSQDKTSDELFNEAEGTLLQIDQLASMIERVEALDETPVDPADRAHLLTFMKEFVMDGLRTVDAIWTFTATNPDSNVNLGELELRHIEGTPANVVKIQAGGNKLTNNVDMSLLEVMTHEYTHAIMRAGVNNDHAIHTEARRLYEIAQENIIWEDFMPLEGDLVGDKADAELAARARYDHIFRNKEGNNYHEFIAIGLTNKRFGEALGGIANAVTEGFTIPASIRQFGLLGAMIQLFRRAMQFVAGNSIENSKGSVRDGLHAMAAEVVKYNQNNQMRLKEIAEGKNQKSKLNRINEAVVRAITDKIADPVLRKLEQRRLEKLDVTDPLVTKGIGLVKTATSVAIRSRDTEVRRAYSKFYKSLGGRKDNTLFEIASEITPFNDDDLGGGIHDSPGWIDLLRKSKTIVDRARQEILQHTKAALLNAMDPKHHLTQQIKRAVTRTVMKTDLSSLISGEQHINLQDVTELLNDSSLARVEKQRLERLLSAELDAQGHSEFRVLFDNAGSSLANYIVRGEHIVKANGLDNAHQIMMQRMRHPSVQVELTNQAHITSLLDRIITLKALEITPQHDIDNALEMINHEMSRTDLPAETENGFQNLMGSNIAFKEQSLAELFDGNPTQMHKGYVYEMFDGEVNVEYVKDTSENNQKMLDKGMVRVGVLPVDPMEKLLNPAAQPRAIYKGLNGLARYNKAVISLADMQSRGANLFTTRDYQSQKALRDLGRMRALSYQNAEEQLLPNTNEAGPRMSPIFNPDGAITDYRYTMSEASKVQLLKKEDPFDLVLPRMYASISDKNNTALINKDAADLLWKEYDALRNDEMTTFVEVGPFVSTKEGRDMYNIMPRALQDDLKAKFGDTIFIRDNAVNTVMGFRKLTVANGEYLGKHTDAVRMAERWWQEIVQLERIKIAVLTPAVVIGNAVSNLMMLLSAGIPPNYIRKMGSEAISAMRQYVKDVRQRDILTHEIGVKQALGKDTRVLENQVARLNADVESNPVGKLVDEGLFTSITEDLGIDEQSLRGNLLTKAKDKLSDKVPQGAITAVSELYMLPGSKGYKAGVAATQYGDFVARYIKFNYDTNVLNIKEVDAINKSLAAFIYYDMPQNRYLQYANDTGFIMFTKFFLRIQHVVAQWYTQNPVSAFGVLGLQQALLSDPLDENIAHYGLGGGLGRKFNLNVVSAAAEELNPIHPASFEWIKLLPFVN